MLTQAGEGRDAKRTLGCADGFHYKCEHEPCEASATGGDAELVDVLAERLAGIFIDTSYDREYRIKLAKGEIGNTLATALRAANERIESLEATEGLAWDSAIEHHEAEVADLRADLTAARAALAAAERLCRIYFEIAADATSEEAVREKVARATRAQGES